MACASEPAGKLEKSVVRDHLYCPICLETYRSPRALSCMHTYCEECIDSVIVKNADQWLVKMAIECPVCLKESPPPAPTKPPVEWAKSLPMNYAILSLLETVATETENRICGPCQVVNENIPAASFCLECKEYICDKCAKRHTKFSANTGHKIIEIREITEETVPSLDFGKMEYCDTHPAKEIEFFCEDHDVLCCSICAIVGHRPCQKVVEVKELGGNLKQGDRPGILLTRMGNLQDELEHNTKSLESNVTALDIQSVDIKQKIEDTRHTLLQQVNQLMDRLSSDCDRLQKENTIKLEDEIFQKKSQLAALTSSCSLLGSTLERGSDAQAFIAYHKIQQQVRQCQARFQQDRDGAATLQLALDLGNVPDIWRQCEQKIGNVSVKSQDGAVNEHFLMPLVLCEEEEEEDDDEEYQSEEDIVRDNRRLFEKNIGNVSDKSTKGGAVVEHVFMPLVLCEEEEEEEEEEDDDEEYQSEEDIVRDIRRLFKKKIGNVSVKSTTGGAVNKPVLNPFARCKEDPSLHAVYMHGRGTDRGRCCCC